MSEVVAKSNAEKEMEKVLWFLFNLLMLGMLCIFVGLGYVTHQYEHVQLPLQFASWSKHTGNPGNLTFEEWKHLPKGNRKY